VSTGNGLGSGGGHGFFPDSLHGGGRSAAEVAHAQAAAVATAAARSSPSLTVAMAETCCHSSQRVTRSTVCHASNNGGGGGGEGGGGGRVGVGYVGSERSSADYDYHFLDSPDGQMTPRLKRYPSARASVIWRHQ